MLEMFVIQHTSIWPNYAAILMMTSQILKSAGFAKTQKSRYLENETLFFLQIKKIINYTSSAALWERIVL